MLAFRRELILSLFLTASSLRPFPQRAQQDPDDNEEVTSSAYSSLESSELDHGRTPSLAVTPPKPPAARFPFGRGPRLSPPLPEVVSHQWSTFLGLQRGREGAPARGEGPPFRSPGFPSPARPGGFFRRRGPAVKARGPALAFPGSLWENRKTAAAGLQIQKTTGYGIWGPAPNFIQGEHFQAKQRKQGLQAKMEVGHDRPFRQNAEDLPARQGTDDGVRGSGAGPTDSPRTKLKAKARGRDPSALPTRLDTESRQRTAEEAWRRLIEKGRGVTEEIVLPLTEREATRTNCRTLPFTQTISHPDCQTFTVQNRLCFGQCSSFFIPGTEQRLYRSCSRCFPSQLRKTTVLLECEGDLVVSKEVTLVEECKCDLEKEQHLEN